MSKYPKQKCPVCDAEVSTHWKPWRSHMSTHLDLASDNKDCYTGNTPAIIDPENEESPVRQFIEHAVRTGVVAVAVEHKKLFSKKRIKKNVLFITMGRMFGDPRAVVFGLSGGGCEVCDINDLKVTPLVSRVGIPASMAQDIVAALKDSLSKHGYY